MQIICPMCQEEVTYTENTKFCPSCGALFGDDLTQRLNKRLKFEKTADNIEKVGNGMQATGSFITGCGCLIMLAILLLMLLGGTGLFL